MEQQGPSSTPALLATSPDTTLAPIKLTASQILDYFQMPDSLLDTPHFIKSYQTLNKALHPALRLYCQPMESEEQAFYAKVYTVLKAEHHFFFKKNYGPAVKKFIKSASDRRSTCISHIKNEVFHSIFGLLLPPSAAVKGFDPFTDPHCQELLGYDPQKKILLAIFFGATSIKEKTVTKKKPMNAVLWQVEQITPSAITFTAIVARYVLSGDEHFDKCGGHSCIPYAANFKFYKMTIIQNLNKSHMVETVAAFNCYLFEDVQLTEETVGHDSKLALAPTTDVPVDELVSSIASVTLHNYFTLSLNEMPETEHPSGATSPETELTATDPENLNQSQNDLREIGGLPRAPPACRSTRTTHQTQAQGNDDIIEEDDVYGS
ncbi:hypothetical protein EDD18DRAFT_1114208 [Armillaria luteobubalina]|uniref:Uncharacterized protein n=1 Tax=Armillaria luteobubalina TaxID=153913 RepID=A0AA39P5Z7_9AGAR|nr:hypothetical protein EDD18DRAFT_1114208 [Armillaria luteobubalina]